MCNFIITQTAVFVISLKIPSIEILSVMICCVISSSSFVPSFNSIHDALSGVDGLKFLPQLWSNMGEKRTETRSVHVHELDFIALNDCFWVTWHNGGEKMFKSITFCENCFGTSNSYPIRGVVSWGSPTPLDTLQEIWAIENWPASLLNVLGIWLNP